jgi:hypothetical protein
MFAGVDLDLEPHPVDRLRGCLEAIDEGDPTVTSLVLRPPKPTVEPFTDRVDGRADRARLKLDEVDVLGVSARSLEKELV